MNLKKFLIGNKKASMLDTIFIAVSVAVLMVFIVFGYKIITATNTEVQAMDSIPTIAKNAYGSIEDKYVGVMDVVFLLFWLASFLGSVISAWFIDTHPVFFVLSIIVLIAIMVGIVPLSNVVESILIDSNLVATTANFPIILWFTQHFFTIVLVQGFIISFSLYAKVGGGY